MSGNLSRAAAFFHADPVRIGDLVTVDPEEDRHMRASRLRRGDRVILLDGRGGRAEGVLERIERRGGQVRIERMVLESRERGPYIALAIALLSDRSRIEWVVEKGTELGVAEILLLQTDRSEGRIHGDRLHRVATAALKQSQQSFLPSIRLPVSTGGLLEESGRFERVFLCHEEAPLHSTLRDDLADDPPHGGILLLIGPEGGFSDREVEKARACSARIVSLGPIRLRADTAALTAVVTTTCFVHQTPHRE